MTKRRLNSSPLDSGFESPESVPLKGVSDSTKLSKLLATSVKEIEEFEKLSPKEKYACFRQKSYEIKQLQRKLRKYSRKAHALDLQLRFHKASDILKKGLRELADNKSLLDYLIEAIQRSKLKQRNSRFLRISAIVKAALSEESKEPVTSPKAAQRRSKHCPHSTKTHSPINAVPKEEAMRCISTALVDGYIRRHSEILKGMSYEELVKSMKYSHHCSCFGN